MKPTALVTGATGFIGSYVIRAFLNEGYNVVALSRRQPGDGVAHCTYSLGDDLPCEGHILVHCAHDSAAVQHNSSINYTGTARLFESARARGISKIVFISSLAAADGTSSYYGRQKQDCERLLSRDSDLIVRPGLVVGDGGLFQTMYRSVRKFGAAPLFSGGRQPVYTVSVHDLCAGIIRLVGLDASGLYTLASQKPVELRDIYDRLGDLNGIATRLIPLPYGATLFAASWAERLGIRLPITSENLRGIQNLRPLEVPSLDALGITLRDFDAALADFTSELASQ